MYAKIMAIGDAFRNDSHILFTIYCKLAMISVCSDSFSLYYLETENTVILTDYFSCIKKFNQNQCCNFFFKGKMQMQKSDT